MNVGDTPEQRQSSQKVYSPEYVQYYLRMEESLSVYFSATVLCSVLDAVPCCAPK